jgi:hypothetical protein
MIEQAKGGEFDLPSGDKFEQALSAILKKRACRFSGNSGFQIKVDKVSVRPWILRNMPKWLGRIENSAIRAELKKNGAISSNVLRGDFGKKDD